MPEREESAEELNDDLRQALNCYIEDSCSDLDIRITALENKMKDLQDDIGRFIAAYYLIKNILKRHEAEIKKIQEGQH